VASLFLPWLAAEEAGGRGPLLLWARNRLRACWHSLVTSTVVLLLQAVLALLLLALLLVTLLLVVVALPFILVFSPSRMDKVLPG